MDWPLQRDLYCEVQYQLELDASRALAKRRRDAKKLERLAQHLTRMRVQAEALADVE